MRKLYFSFLAVLFLTAFAINQAGAQCVPSAPQTFTNSTPLAIPAGPAVVTSTIVVAGAPAYLYDLNVITTITHTFCADLDITITSPSGTVVTLTTDNGAGNDNLFNGTTWDDDANPGGTVPYTNNNGLVTDHLFTNLVTATPLVPEEPLGAFIGENPNGVWTITISDDLGGDAGNLSSWSLVTSGFLAAPTLSTTTIANNTPLAIPTGPAVVTSTINVVGLGTELFDVNMLTNLTHTFASDLDITITSPAGTVVTLTTDNGGGNDDVFAGTIWDDDANPAGLVPYVTNNGMATDHAYANLTLASPLTPEEALAAFIGENPNGIWTITISDDLAGDGGSLNNWSLTLTTGTCLAPCIASPTQTFTNSTPLTVPTGPAVVSSTLTVVGAPVYLFDINVITNLTHTFSADLDITIQSPSGTVVTLTTDNGAGNDNNFNGTTWDDNANPAGQVPYVTNNGLATDQAYVNLVTATPLAPEEPLAAFIGENPNGVWTITISDDLAGDGGTLSSWSLAIRGVSAPPVLANTSVTNSTPLAIPTGPAVVTSTVNVAGAGNQIFDVNLRTFITHTFAADLDITLQSPAGTVVTLTTDNGAGNDDVFNGTIWDDDANPAGQVPYTTNNGLATDHSYVNLTVASPLAPEEALGAFIGENPNGIWTITISDDLTGDGGSLNSWTLDLQTSLCSGLTCSGTPVAGTISGPATACIGTNGVLTLSGQSSLPGISIQWKSSTTAGGPYTNIAGATNTTYNFTATGITRYYIATVTCASSGLSANTPEFTVTQGAPVHSAIGSTITNACSPGNVTVTGTAINGGPGLYTHVLTGPGTIGAPVLSGPNNSSVSFAVSNLPAGTHSFVLTTTDGIGCTTASNITGIIIKQTPIITLVPAAPVICNGTIQQITATVVPPTVVSVNQPVTTNIPAGSPTTTNGIADPYPSQVNVAGLPATGVTVKSVKLGNINHTFPSDIDVVLVSPTGQAVILMSDIGAGADIVGLDYTLDDAAPTSLIGALNPQGTYKPTNIGAGDSWPAPGPLGTPTSTTLSTFTNNPNGTWSLYIFDDTGGDVGYIGNWSIDFNVPSLVTFSPITNLFTDPAATIPYLGQPISVVYARPTTTTLYTATSTVAGCTGMATVNVTVNQLPAITVQPTPATQTICPGFNVTYSVTATGTGITYQWRQGVVNLVDNAQISGATTNSLTITNVNAGNTGTYTCVVSGVCPPAVTSSPVVLNVATAPIISTQPANTTVCVGANASFTVATVGSVPPANIYQWQVSTDGGATWTNLTTGGSFTPTFTITGAVIGQHNNRYRVLVTNFCGQTTTSAAAILTVNALPIVTATPLPSRICISDTLVPLSGSPVGGSWSGIGVSGFNFVPAATAVGTYTLTYTFTNPAGCTATANVIAKVEDCQERIRLLSDDGLILYPNPNNGLFNIRINSTLYNYLGMKIYNSQGQLLNGKAVNGVLVSPVYTGLVYGRVIPVDLTRLPAGIYFVKFYYDDGVRTSEKSFKVVIPGH